jgi:hypothetical protein
MKPNGRFATILADNPVGRDIYDQPLLITPEWAVAPTLGAIVPNWLIVIPRRPALNFRNWFAQTGRNPETVIAALLAHLSLTADHVLWFEHGPRQIGTDVGCGVDYAHLHVIIYPEFSFNTLMRQIETSAKLNWQRGTSGTAYSQLSGENSYLVLGKGECVTIAERVEEVGSQFLRRMIAALSGQAHSWNYRRYQHRQNIVATIETFRALERDAKRRG